LAHPQSRRETHLRAKSAEDELKKMLQLIN